MHLTGILTVVVHPALQEDGMSPYASVKPSSPDEEIFLQRLYDYMDEKQTPIGRIPTLGFQKGNKTLTQILYSVAGYIYSYLIVLSSL